MTMRLFLLFMKMYMRIPVLVLVTAGLVFCSIVHGQEKDEVLPIIKSPSSVGEVAFPHESHFADLEIECQTCHHEINAQKLNMPHKDYFDDFWIDCRICHGHEGGQISQAQSCSNCHHDSPTDIADETLSAKVVIHKNCWECHEVEKGKLASQSCRLCHIPAPESQSVP